MLLKSSSTYLVIPKCERACVLVPPCLSGNRHGASWVVASVRPTSLLRGEPTCRCRQWLRRANVGVGFGYVQRRLGLHWHTALPQ